MKGKRSEWIREQAFTMYVRGRSDYEISDRCGVSVHTIESWKRLFGWRGKRKVTTLSITVGIPAIATGSYTVETTEEIRSKVEGVQEPGTRSGRRLRKLKTYEKRPSGPRSEITLQAKKPAISGENKAIAAENPPLLPCAPCESLGPGPDIDERYDRPDVNVDIDVSPVERHGSKT